MTAARTKRQRSEISSRPRVLLVATVAGVALGIFSVLADGILPGRLFDTLGNLASPWGLAAFLVGLRATSPRQGALAGGLTLVVGVATYYLGAALRGYVTGGTTLVWTVVAALAGPIMGLSGASVSSRPARPPVVAVAAPSTMLVAEAIFFIFDRRVWLYDLGAEPYRLVDLGLVAAFLLGALVLPPLFVKEGRRRAGVYLLVTTAGACGALGFVLLSRLIAGG
jgi:hypothetical protein